MVDIPSSPVEMHLQFLQKVEATMWHADAKTQMKVKVRGQTSEV